MRKLKFGLVVAMGFAGVLGASIPATAAVASDALTTSTSTLEKPATGAATVTSILHVQSGLCLDGSVSNGVRLKACNGSTYQSWDVQNYRIRHVQSGLCLDGSVSNGVRLNTCNTSSYQEWYSPGSYDVVHVQSGLCLDGSVSNGVRLKACNGTVYQEWV